MSTTDESRIAQLVREAASGNADAQTELFSQYRDRLKRMVRLRLNRRLQGRVDDSDIIQEALIEAARKMPEYAHEPILPFYLWLRHLTGLKLVEIHRRHLGTKMRDAGMEVSLHRGGLPGANSVSLAAFLLGTMTSVSQAAIKAEKRLALQEALNDMDPLDRELVAMKHFEQMTIDEMAQALDIPRSTVGRHYLKALQQLKSILQELPEFQ